MNKKGIMGLVILLVGILLAIGFYFFSLSPVSSEHEIVEFNVSGGTNKIINDLYDANIIRNKMVTKVYMKLHPSLTPKAGKYKLDRKNDTRKIMQIISDYDNAVREDTTKITFIEGKRLIDYVSQISEEFGYSEEEILNTINDKEYLRELINKYYFLTDDILDNNIYYPLEGYLYPATYEFYKSASIKSIVEKMLDKQKNILDNYSAPLKGSKYSIHEILTMASIIESETVVSEDRAIVSQVIYKRLDMNMSLGMDVTAAYGAKITLKELYELNKQGRVGPILKDDNAYNTRNTSFLGLPVGPICNPREESIQAALNPSNTNYVYFYADEQGKDGVIGKLFFAENIEEFQRLISKYS